MKKLVDEVGKVYPTTKSGDIEIIEYINANKVLVKFVNTGEEKLVRMKEVRKGNVFDRQLPIRKGVGIIGDGAYKTKIDGEYTKEFSLWKDMIDRCDIKQTKYPAYVNVTVCESWFKFQNFAEWCNNQKGFMVKDEKGNMFDLDKDILVKGNKVYSPETCCFVPREINATLTLRRNFRGGLPIGVSKFYVKSTGKTRYEGNISIDKRITSLGSYDSPQEAFQAYKEAKESRVKFLADKWISFITQECYNALYNWEINIDE